MCRYGSSAEQQEHLLVLHSSIFCNPRVLHIGRRLVDREGRAELVNMDSGSRHRTECALYRQHCGEKCFGCLGRTVLFFIHLVSGPALAAEVPVVLLC